MAGAFERCVWGAAVLAAFAAGWALREGRHPTADADAREPHPRAATPDSNPPVDGPRRRSRVVSGVEAGAEPCPDPSAHRVPIERGSTTVFEVTVQGAAERVVDLVIEPVDATTGQPVPDVSVVALPGGLASTGELTHPVPAHKFKGVQPCRLRVAAPAAYDVFVLTTMRRVRLASVRVTEDLRLRVPLPTPVPVTVRRTGSEPPWRALRVLLRPDIAEFRAAFKALGWDQHAWFRVDLAADTAEATSFVPAVAGPWETLAPAGGRITPEPFSPPGVLEVSPGARRVGISCQIEFAEPWRTWEEDRRLRCRFAAPDGDDWRLDWWLEAGKPLSSVKSLSFTVNSDETVGALRWDGEGFASGEVAYDATSGSASARAVVTVLNPPRGWREVRVAAADNTSPLAEVHTVGGDVDDDDVLVDSFDADERPRVRSEAEWVMAYADAPAETGAGVLVGGPVQPRGDGPVDVRLRRAGFVAVSIPTVPEECAVTIQRADGAPLLSQTEEDPYGEFVVSVERSTFLGPFEPGEVVLDVRVGGVSWRRYAVLIREGATELLSLPSIGR